MNLAQFQQQIEAIPAEHWEEQLDIGTFQSVKCLNLAARTFSFVSRCRVTGSKSAVNVYAKIYRKALEDPENWSFEEMEHEQEKMTFWYDLFKGHRQYQVVRPLGIFPDLKMSLTQESQGMVLNNLIAKKLSGFPDQNAIGDMEKALFAVGQWLSYKDEVLPPEKNAYQLNELFDYVDLRLRLLVEEKAQGFREENRSQIMDFYQQRAGAIPPAHLGLVLTHSDFNPSNILVDHQTITVLDFGRQVADSALLDMVKLCHQIFLFSCKPTYQKRHLERLQQALLEGYGTPNLYKDSMFKLLFIRNILTHLLASHRRRGKGGIHQRLYDSWVEAQERRKLKELMKD